MVPSVASVFTLFDDGAVGRLWTVVPYSLASLLDCYRQWSLAGIVEVVGDGSLVESEWRDAAVNGLEPAVLVLAILLWQGTPLWSSLCRLWARYFWGHCCINSCSFWRSSGFECGVGTRHLRLTDLDAGTSQTLLDRNCRSVGASVPIRGKNVWKSIALYKLDSYSFIAAVSRFFASL